MDENKVEAAQATQQAQKGLTNRQKHTRPTRHINKTKRDLKEDRQATQLEIADEVTALLRYDLMLITEEIRSLKPDELSGQKHKELLQVANSVLRALGDARCLLGTSATPATASNDSIYED